MIEVRNLCKTYEDSSGVVKALNNVSFVLPTKGMVFIVGKSGCGKTTLLNIIGGLDNLTSGDVFINNMSLSHFSIKDLDNYRNTTIGFVFQDFCLIDRMSVKDNIKMSLDFQNSNKKVNYSKLLRDFGLTGLGRRKPTQLSAGQKQRVAIARAIVKDPEIILADEPTGNVDERTSIQIMEILKEISKEKLVVIISHNTDEAYRYGDRIIEMSDGCIIKDNTLNKNSLKSVSIINNEIILPGHGDLSNVDLELLNHTVAKSDGNIKVSQSAELFNKQDVVKDNKNIHLKEAKMGTKTKLKFASFFFKKKIVFNLFIILLITFVTSFFSIVEILGFVRNNFEINRMINERGYEQYILNPYKGGNIYKIDEEEIKVASSLYETDYNPILNVAFSTHIPNKSNTNYYVSAQKPYSSLNNLIFSNGYINETSGVMITNEKRLKELVGDYSLLAGEIKSTGDGVIITDYVADSLLFLSKEKYNSYEDIVNGGYIQNRVDVDAIIKTDVYKKYPNLIDDWNNYRNQMSTKNILITLYAMTFSFNSNFKDDYISNYKNVETPFIIAPALTCVTSKGTPFKETRPGYSFFNDLEDDEMHMEYSLFNKCFGTKYTTKNLNTFTGDSFVIEIKDYEGNVLCNKKFRITKLFIKDFYYDEYHLSKSNYDDFFEDLVFTYSLSIDTSKGRPYDFINFFSTQSNDKEFYYHSPIRECQMAYSVVELFSAFKQVFKFISYLLIAAIFLIIILNANTLIKHNVYELGLMKAFGAKTKDLVMMFAVQMVFSSLIVCGLLYTASEIFINFADTLLKNGVLAYSGTKPEYLQFHTFVFLDGYFFINISLIASATILSVIVPIVAIRKIKPLTIIRTKN